MNWLVDALVAMGSLAVLFAVFGLWVRLTGCGGNCGSCTTGSCERKVRHTGETS